MLIVLRHLGGSLHHQISVLLHVEHLLDVVVEHSHLVLFVLQLFQVFEELLDLRGFALVHQSLESIQVYQTAVTLINFTGIHTELHEVKEGFHILRKYL